MASSTFYIPFVNEMGEGSLEKAIKDLNGSGFKNALIVSDAFMNKSGVVKQVADLLKAQGIDSAVYDGVMPNPTVTAVLEGLKILKDNNSDLVVSLGGGSPHDCAKAIALVATNGGEVKDYEGIDKSKKPALPLMSINTTAGTASEMTRFCIITDEVRHVKMAIVDRHVTPMVSVNDPLLMVGMPKGLTAATGMDALTHAFEAYSSTAADPITDACALKAASMIAKNLKTACDNGKDMPAREAMAYAEFLAGMAFNNASLGYVHAMAHQLGGYYNLPHGVCNAVLLPHVLAYNASVVAGRLKDVGVAMGLDIANLGDKEGAEATIQAVRDLSASIGIPANLTELGAKKEDVPLLADHALKDACALTNPRQGTQKEVEELFLSAF
ncbi:MAG: L-threonine dehydrogenase [Zymomonas mobilis]|uniref:L-threonine dehydrogenase n=2 Tax=Zymomonas mobilis TaxID=542 RepID=UPI0039E802C6